MNIKIQLDEKAYMPTKAHEADAGFDLYTPKGFILRAYGHMKIDLGVHIEIPEGFYGQIEGRSGLASNNGIFPIGGVIDSGYTGSIAVTLVNTRNGGYYFNKGDRIAQLVLHEVPKVTFEQVDKLGETERGSNGFGSTGK